MADIRERIIIESVDNTTRGMRTAQNRLNAFDRTLRRVQTTLLGFVGINIGIHFIQATARMSDSAVELEAKLRLMTEGTEDFNYAQQELVKLSLESGSSLEANTILFTRMNKAIKSMGGNTQTTLDTTRALSQGLRISGASTQESASVIRQWSQAMASGVLRGEEFNAVSENGARIIQAISESLGVTIGELREMSKEGQLTAQKVTQALLEQSKTIAEENAKLPLTIGRAIENVNTQYLLFLQDLKSGNSAVAEGINVLANNFDGIIGALTALLKLGGAYVTIGLARAFIKESKAIRQKIIDQKASAEATLIETQRQEQLIVSKRQADAVEKRFALTKAKAHVSATQQHITELQNTVQRIALTDKENLSKISALKRQIAWEARINNSQRISVANQNKLIVLQQRARLSSESLRTAKMSLTGAEQTLTTAIIAQNRALALNTLAQRTNNTVVTSGLSKFTTGIKGLISKFSPLDTLFAGVIGYQIGTYLYEQFEWVQKGGILFVGVVEKLISGFVLLKDIVSAVFTDDTVGEAYDRHLERYNRIRTLTNQMWDDVGKKTDETVSKLKDAGDQRIADATTVTEQLKKLEDELLENVHSKIDRNLELGKIALSQKITNESQYRSAVAKLEDEAEELRVQATIESSNRQLGQIQEFYDSKVVLQELASTVLADSKKSIDDLQFSIQKSHDERLLNLSHKQAVALKEVSKQTLDALLADSTRLANKQREAVNRGISVIKEASDFIKSTNGDQRSSYQKLADAHKAQRQIETDLRKASKAELKGDHEEAQRLREKALSDSKDLTNSYKDIVQSSKDGSISQVQANSDIQKALDLVKKSADGVKKSTDAIGESAGEDLDVRKTQIEQYQKIISELDKQINKTRLVEVDINAEQAYNQISTLDQKIKALSQDVVVSVLTKNGGITGDNAVQRASGGFIPRSDRVPGTGSGDKVKALLEPGEFIMRKSAVQKFGESAMYAMNRGNSPVRKYALGGIVDSGIDQINRAKDLATSIFKMKNTGDEKSLAERLLREYKEFEREQIKKSQIPLTDENSFNIINKSKTLLQYAKNLSASMSTAQSFGNGAVGKVAKFNEEILKAIQSKPWKQGVIEELQFQRAKVTGSSPSFVRPNLKLISETNVPDDKKRGVFSTTRFANGGDVQGSGLGDTVRALLTPGEFVMKKSSVAQFGSDFMNSINQGIMPARFATGGIVGTDIGGAETINVNFNIGGNQAVGTFTKNDATMEFINQLKQSEASS